MGQIYQEFSDAAQRPSSLLTLSASWTLTLTGTASSARRRCDRAEGSSCSCDGKRQLHPLRQRQSFAHFQRHRRICSFKFGASLNDSIDLRKNRVAIQWISFEEFGELRFLFLERFRLRSKLLLVV